MGGLRPGRDAGAVMARLNALVNASLADPATRAELERQGMAVMGGTPEQFAAHARGELARQREVVQAAGITVE
jgi:tripartite-type tricarboxylate transporter receptor subunit TctC